MAKDITKSGLGIILSKLKGFEEPKVSAEQYTIEPEIAAEVLWKALYAGKVRDHTVADLGCGTGIIGIGALILGANRVFFIDNDENIIKTAKNNLEKVKSETSYNIGIKGEAVFINQDIADFDEKVDTVIMNPPFGIKVRHADKAFLEKAVKAAGTIYSFHKSESRGFISAFSGDNGFRIAEIMDFSWPLKQTMGYHRQKIRRIPVSCFVLEKKQPV